MPDIKFRWPEEDTQYVEPKQIRRHKNDEYLDNGPLFNGSHPAPTIHDDKLKTFHVI